MRDNYRLHRDHRCSCSMKQEHDGGLSDLLDRCGHYYTHRIGGSHRGQESALLWLSEHSDVTQKELGEGLGITPASLSEVLAKLERKGYIERFKDEADRRFIRVRLTEEGEAALDVSANKGGDPFAALSEEEQQTLKNLLAKLLADWEVRYMADRNRRNRRQAEGGRDFSRHGNEHPGHDSEHPGHGRDHQNERDERRGRDPERRGHEHR